MDKEWYLKVRRALEKSWSKKTCDSFDPEIAPLSYGQCAPTAMIVYEKFGGEILKTEKVNCDKANGQKKFFKARVSVFFKDNFSLTRDDKKKGERQTSVNAT